MALRRYQSINIRAVSIDIHHPSVNNELRLISKGNGPMVCTGSGFFAIRVNNIPAEGSGVHGVASIDKPSMREPSEYYELAAYQSNRVAVEGFL